MNAETSTSRERRKLPHRCGQDNCPAKWGYIADGFLYCRNGHHQPDFQQVLTQETERFAASQGDTARAKKDKTLSGTASRVITGRSSYYIYLACYQQLLKAQCQALIQTKGFPVSFEQCVKDLWALRLPLVHERFGSKLARGQAKDVVGEHEEEDDDDGDAASQVLYSSQQQPSDDESVKGSKGMRNRLIPNIKESVALLHMAAMLLRIPLSIATLQTWCRQNPALYEFAYMKIPPEIMENMETRYQKLFHPSSPLRSNDLHTEVRKLVVVYSDELQISVPPLNYRPLLHFHIQSLGLPLQLYRTVQCLIAFLGFDFSFSTQWQSRRYMTWSPETQLLAVLVVATKLLYPFPPTPPTYARSNADPYILRFSWESWLSFDAKRTAKERQNASLHAGNELNVTELDVLNFTPQQMDSYMDWFTQTFVARTGQKKRILYSRSRLSEQLVNMFPLPGEVARGPDAENPDDRMPVDGVVSHEASNDGVENLTQIVTAITKAFQEREVVSDQASQRTPVAGSYYQLYKRSSDLKGIEMNFHKQAAAQCANSVEVLLDAVQDVEKKIHWALRAKPS